MFKVKVCKKGSETNPLLFSYPLVFIKGIFVGIGVAQNYACYAMNIYRPLNLPTESKFKRRFEDNISVLTLLLINHKPLPQKYKNLQLYQWMSSIKSLKKLGKLHPDYCKRLDAIGFKWNLHENNWQEQYQALRRMLFKGHYLREGSGYNGLHTWIVKQQEFYKKGELSAYEREQWEALDECTFFATNIYPIEERKGLSEEERQRRWNSNFNELVNSINNPPYRWPQSNNWDLKKRTLFMWFKKQKEDFAIGLMNENNTIRWNTLDLIDGKEVRIAKEVWNVNFKLVKESFLLNKRSVLKQDKLYKWCNEQNGAFDTLSTERQALLDSIDFRKYFKETDWDVKYRWLMDYIKENKERPTPSKNPTLSTWLMVQKRYCREKKLNAVQTKKILDIIKKHVDTRSNLEVWMCHFNDLIKFREEHTFWPRRRSNESSEHTIFIWCQSQKMKGSNQCKRSTPLTEHQVNLLNSIGFKWTDDEVYQTRWMGHFVKLKNYIERVGSFIIPEIEDGERTVLYRWLSAQKKAIVNETLDAEKIGMLTTLGLL